MRASPTCQPLLSTKPFFFFRFWIRVSLDLDSIKAHRHSIESQSNRINNPAVTESLLHISNTDSISPIKFIATFNSSISFLLFSPFQVILLFMEFKSSLHFLIKCLLSVLIGYIRSNRVSSSFSVVLELCLLPSMIWYMRSKLIRASVAILCVLVTVYVWRLMLARVYFVTIMSSFSGEGIKYITFSFVWLLDAKMKPDILEVQPQELTFLCKLISLFPSLYLFFCLIRLIRWQFC